MNLYTKLLLLSLITLTAQGMKRGPEEMEVEVEDGSSMRLADTREFNKQQRDAAGKLVSLVEMYEKAKAASEGSNGGNKRICAGLERK